MVQYFLVAATAAYLLASAFYLQWMLSAEARLRPGGLWVMIGATVLAAVGFGVELSQMEASQAASVALSQHVLWMLTLGASVILLLVRGWRELPLYGTVLGPLGAVVMGVLALKAAGFGPTMSASSMGAVTVVHVGSTLLGVMLFLPAYVLSLLFLHQEYRLRSRRPGAGGMMSLLSLEQRAWRLLMVGFPFYSLGIVLGVVWQERSASFGLQAQHVLAALGWGLYGLAILRRFRTGWRGRHAALTLMGAFLATLGSVLLYGMR